MSCHCYCECSNIKKSTRTNQYESDSSTQMASILTCSSETTTKPEVTRTNDPIKWTIPSRSKYHQNCTEKTKQKQKHKPTKLKRRTVPSQNKDLNCTKKPERFRNECYCCDDANETPPFVNDLPPSCSHFEHNDVTSVKRYSLPTLEKARCLLNYSPESKFLKRFRHEVKPKESEDELKFTEQRKLIEDELKPKCCCRCTSVSEMSRIKEIRDQNYFDCHSVKIPTRCSILEPDPTPERNWTNELRSGFRMNSDSKLKCDSSGFVERVDTGTQSDLLFQSGSVPVGNEFKLKRKFVPVNTWALRYQKGVF